MLDCSSWLKAADGGARWQVTIALGKIKDARAVEPLIATLKAEDPYLRELAAEALGEIDDASAVARLLTGWKEHDIAVIVGASRFFVRRGEPGTEDTLIQALNAKGNVRMANALLNCGNSDYFRSGAYTRWATVEFLSYE